MKSDLDKFSNNQQVSDRIKFELYLKPDKESTKHIEILKAVLREYGLITNSSSLEPHVTLYGFYSSAKKLKFSSEDALEYRLITNCRNVNTLFNKKQQDKLIVTDFFDKKMVLLVNDDEKYFQRMHEFALKSFESMTVLSTGDTPEQNPEYFSAKYPFTRTNYTPHITIGDVNKNGFVDFLVRDILGFRIGFDELILAKKESSNYVKIYSQTLN